MAQERSSEAQRIEEISPADLRRAVGERYGEVAIDPAGPFTFPVGRQFAEAVGYPPAVLDRLPAAASASFAGATYLTPWLELAPGETVLDLGCGAGLDSLIAAQAVGPEGRVIGIDVAEPMVALARANAGAVPVTNAEFHQAAVEALPLDDASVDVAMANGIVNLSPEKARALAEVFRVLRPGGRLVAAEIVLTRDIPRSERATLDDWFR